jgi:hypothetical protein
MMRGGTASEAGVGGIAAGFVAIYLTGFRVGEGNERHSQAGEAHSRANLVSAPTGAYADAWSALVGQVQPVYKAGRRCDNARSS